jgi:hypothetical protein
MRSELYQLSPSAHSTSQNVCVRSPLSEKRKIPQSLIKFPRARDIKLSVFEEVCLYALEGEGN